MDTTSLRLPSHVTEQLDRLAEERGTTRSELIREAVADFLSADRASGAENRVAALRRLVTYPGSGRKDGGARSEEHLRAIFDARRRRRSR